MLGDVGDPHLVGTLGVEVPVDVFVMNGPVGALAAAPPAHADGCGPQPLLVAQPPDTALPDEPASDAVAGAFELVGEEAVPELGIVSVRVDQRVRQVDVVELALDDRVGVPGVTGLA